MTFEVLKAFSDLKDEKHLYMVGDTFPRHGFSVSEERLNELKGNKNSFGCPLIKEREEPSAEPSKPAEIKAEEGEATDSAPVAKKPQKRAKKAE